MNIIKKILGIRTERSAEVINLNSRAILEKDYEKSIKLFDEALKIDPRDIVTLNNKRNILLSHGKLDEAELIFKKSYDLNPKDVDTIENYSDVLADKERFPEAIQILKKAYRLSEEKEGVLDKIGMYFYWWKKYKEAIYYFDKALKINEYWSDSIYNKSRALYELGKKDEAFKIMEKYINHWRKCHFMVVYFAEDLFNQGDNNESLRYLNVLLKHNPKNLPALMVKINVLKKEGKKDEVKKIKKLTEKLAKAEEKKMKEWHKFLKKSNKKEKEKTCGMNVTDIKVLRR